MKTNFFVLVIFFTAILFSCEKEPKPCPSCSDQVSWDNYGLWKLEAEGWDGYSNDGTFLKGDCGWTISGNNTGGIGKVYAVQSFNGGVIFVWAWGTFSAIILREGWCGSTKEGIKMGDSSSKFLLTYPYFNHYEYNSSILEYKTKEKHVEAAFSEDDKLIEVYISNYN